MEDTHFPAALGEEVEECLGRDRVHCGHTQEVGFDPKLVHSVVLVGDPSKGVAVAILGYFAAL